MPVETMSFFSTLMAHHPFQKHRLAGFDKDSRSNLSTTTIPLLTICQRDWLSAIMNMVVVVRPSLKLKKRPVAAGLFVI